VTQLPKIENYRFQLGDRSLLLQRAVDEGWTGGSIALLDWETRDPVARCVQVADGSRTFETFDRPLAEDVLAFLLDRMEATFDDSLGNERPRLESLAESLSPRLKGVHISLVKRCPPFEGLGAVEEG